jgi:hypothetical protein
MLDGEVCWLVEEVKAIETSINSVSASFHLVVCGCPRLYVVWA